MNTKTSASEGTIERLLAAVSQGREEVVAELLAAGTDPNGTDADGIQTPLLNVAKTSHEGLPSSAGRRRPVGKANADHVTPLHWAAARQQLVMARLLLAAGASVHAVERDGWTPLHWAAFRGEAEMAELFLDGGAAVNVPDNDGWTPLHLAAQQRHAATVRRLLNAEQILLCAIRSAGWRLTLRKVEDTMMSWMPCGRDDARCGSAASRVRPAGGLLCSPGQNLNRCREAQYDTHNGDPEPQRVQHV